MTSFRIRCMCGIAAVLLLFTAACSSAATTGNGSSTGANGSKSAAATSTPQPTAKPTKPPLTAIPTTTAAYCEGLLSFAEANQMISPVSAIVGVDPANSQNLSTCQFVDAAQQAPLVLGFENFPAGAQIGPVAQEATAKAFHYPNVTVEVSHAVSGVGDQAWFMAGSIAAGNINEHGDVLYIAVGKILLSITNVNINGSAKLGSSDNGTIQNEFVQVANLVIGHM